MSILRKQAECCVFILASVLWLPVGAYAASMVTCPVAAAHVLTKAEQAFFADRNEQAEALYRNHSERQADEAERVLGYTLLLLHEDRLADAEKLVNGVSAAVRDTSAVQTALGELQYREGEPWLAAETVRRAMAADPCYSQLRLLNAQILRSRSMYASAANEVTQAHALDPHDARVSLRWLEGLPLEKRITEIEAYLVGKAGEDPERLVPWHRYLDKLKQMTVEPRETCRPAVHADTASIPLRGLWQDPQHLRGFGIDVQMNHHTARLEIDTGATGILVSRSVAEKAGLRRSGSTVIEGAGDGGPRVLYTAFAERIRIGEVELQDCPVQVMEEGDVLGSQGVIGADVLSSYLVTLDFPRYRLLLSQLPPRDGEAAGEVVENEAGTEAQMAHTTPGDMPRDRFLAPEMKDWTEFYRAGHQVLVPTTVNDRVRKLFILDTGAFATDVVPEVAAKVSRMRPSREVSVYGVSGRVGAVYTADDVTLKFGGVALRSADVMSFATPSLSRDLGVEIGGFLGVSTLKQLTMKIDYRDGLVKFN